MRLIFVLLVPLLLLTASLRADDKAPLEFTRLDLLDGRRLRDVVIKTYDERTGKVLLIASRKAMTVPLTAIPPPFGAKIYAEATRSGTTTSGYSGATPAPRTPPPPPPARTPAPAASVQERSTPAVDLAVHQQTAQQHALTFYRYEFKAGSDAIRVDSVTVETTLPQALTGWSGRYRTQGTAWLDIYDSKGRSYSRAKSTFEIITEQKPGEPPQVIDFSRKS